MKKKKSVAEEFLYGEVNGRKTTARQEHYLHMQEIPHGHHYRLPSGREVKREVFPENLNKGKTKRRGDSSFAMPDINDMI